MLSIILAFFNILPIPALDGGYVLFLLWEIITGKKPSDRFMEIVTTAGFFLLIALMIFALGLDINRLFK
jgi:regulator of sigma E protease